MFRAPTPEPRSRVAPQEHPLPLARRLVLSATALLLALFPRRRAAAHALVVASEPAAGSALAGSPERVWLRFNNRIDRARSRLSLHGPDNGQTPLPLDAAADDETLLSARTGIVPWEAGAWRLRWQVLALDGHITRGDVAFTLRPR
jgi:copper resistance protein C